jgi:FAD/FMN-containing dehydrogenase
MTLSTTPFSRNAISIARLRGELRGRVIGPDDPDYDEARTVFTGGIDRRPAAILRVADAEDVARAVALASETGLPLAVRSGGHSPAGHSVADGGIVLDLRDMRALDIDLEARTAWADAGLTTGEYTAAAATCGLATGFGDTGSVGIGGITLGGGVGLLSRKHGLTVDALLAAEVVTADGRIVRADGESHPDLFWALRGGGGNFGVVTRFLFRLEELDGIIGGMLLLPAPPEVIAGFVAEAQAAPDELTTIASVMPAPPLPFVPPEQHGRPVVMATLAYAGEAESGRRAIAPLRALAEPIVDMVRPMAYSDVFPPEQEGPQPLTAMRTLFVDEIDCAAAETILERLAWATAPMAVTQLRVLGGAVARVPADATAFAHRERRMMANVAAVHGQPERADLHEAWASEFAAALRSGGTGAYVNFLGDEGEERVREAYPGTTWDRLAAIKARYDPTNLFRGNQNVPPAD